MSIHEKLLSIQNELKVPKTQYNSFGKYNYRSCEGILEAVKPLCKAQGLCLTLSDEIIGIDNRFYIKATAQVTDIKTGETLNVTANAREPENKKGMDESQITGTASSYARKYALNGLFDIDDAKDADTDEYCNQTQPHNNKATSKNKSTNVIPESAPEIICPKCGKSILATMVKGKKRTPQEIINTLHMCPECYKAGHK